MSDYETPNVPPATAPGCDPDGDPNTAAEMEAEGETEGMIKVITTKKGVILGCGIAGPLAGELIQTWVLAMAQKIKIGGMATMIAPYPTFGEVSKRAAGSFYTSSLFSDKTRKIVRFLAKFG